ncbi:MAG: hypothetical protein R3277_05410 [Brumimicrobium sp.]|nr:hypothetical protein [Brumimicrobium sp.]
MIPNKVLKALVYAGLILLFSFCTTQNKVPDYLLGKFEDDYEIRYTVTEDRWIQHPGDRYHIIEWNTEEGYILTKNDSANFSDGKLFTRIDYVKLENMDPYQWGFCYTTYNAPDEAEARSNASADKLHPKTGCNGYPFSRMKPASGKEE